MMWESPILVFALVSICIGLVIRVGCLEKRVSKLEEKLSGEEKETE